MSVTLVVIEGLEQLSFVDELTGNTRTALIRALNRVADRARTRAAEAARDQVNFPASYLSPASKRLWVARRARPDSYEAVVEGRGRATSLATFSKQKPLPAGQRHRGGVVDVEVAPGRRKSIRRAFLMNLKSGNVGLAVRTADGEAPPGYKPKEIGKNLWLLYGPSVDQALLSARGGDGIYQDITPEMLELLEDEFNRQMDLLEKQNG